MTVMTFPVIYKSLRGKASPEKVASALSFDGNEVISYTTIDQLVNHVWRQGKLVFPGAWDLERHAADLAAGKAKGTPRQNAYFVATGLMVVDIDTGLPSGSAEETIAWLVATSPTIRLYSGAIFPSSSFSPSIPKLHIIFVLDDVITDSSGYKELHERLGAQIERETGLKPDRSMAKVTQPLYGTVWNKPEMRGIKRRSLQIYRSEAVLPMRTLSSLPQIENGDQERRMRCARVTRIQKEGDRIVRRVKRTKSEIRWTIELVTFILDDLVEKGEKLDNHEWYALRMSAWASSGGANEVFRAIREHPYWQDIWDPDFEEMRWEMEQPHSITAGTLYRLAVDRGFGTTNATDVEPDHVIASIGELPRDASYCLKADTGTGKSQAQKATISDVLRSGKKVCLIVPTTALARAATRDFADLGAQAYVEDDSRRIKTREALRDAEFLVTTPQTFASQIAQDPSNLSRYGLIILDEVQQIGDAAFDPQNPIWKAPITAKFYEAIEVAKTYAKDGKLILRGLDAGLAQQGAEWLELPVYECTFHLEKAPVVLYESQKALLDVLMHALEATGRIYIAMDVRESRRHRLGTKWLADYIVSHFPHKRVLCVDSESTDSRKNVFDPRALQFMNAPNDEASAYDVVIGSPTMLSGVSITAVRADYVFQFCSYLPPKSNLQMLNRFRQQGQVHVWYGGMDSLVSVKTPEAALEQAEALMSAVGLSPITRSRSAHRRERFRYLTELDRHYQALDPRKYYVRLLEAEGRKVTYDADRQRTYALDVPVDDGSHREWVFDHYHELPKYDPLKQGEYRSLEPRELDAMLLHREVDIKTNGGYTNSLNTRYTAEAVHQFETHQLVTVETVSGLAPATNYAVELALDRNTPPSYLRPDYAVMDLLGALSVLGYTGEDEINPELFIRNGQALIAYLRDREHLWNAVFSSRLDADVKGKDWVNDARSVTKRLLSLIGLKMRKGTKTAIRHPDTGVRQNSAQVVNASDLKHVLSLRSVGRSMMNRLSNTDAEISHLCFRNASLLVKNETDADALEWFIAQAEGVQTRVQLELQMDRKLTFSEACQRVRSPTYF
jgi:hypothetical protein